MSWEDDYRNHELWANTQQALETLAQAEDLEPSGNFFRLQALLAYVVSFKDTPHITFTESHLAAVNAMVTTIQQQLPGNIDVLFKNAANNQPGAFAKLASSVRAWPAPDRTKLRGLGKQVEMLESNLQSLDTRITKQAEDIDEAIDTAKVDFQDVVDVNQATVDKAATDATAQIDTRLTELDNKLEQIKQAAETAKSTTADQVQRLEEALRAHQDNFTEAQEERRKEWSDLLDANQRSLDEHMLIMEEYGEKSRKVLAAVGVNSTATDFGNYANTQAKIANRWRIGAVAAYSAAALIFVYLVFFPHATSSSSLEWWQFILQKLTGPGGAAAVGFFLQRESGQHRKEERNARETQLTLTALEPFIANLPSDQQQQIRRETAQRIFSKQRGGNRATEDNEDTTE